MTPTTLRQAPQLAELEDPRLGRLPEFDAASLNYPMRELVAQTKRLQTKRWKIRQRLNQGSKPHCATYSAVMEIGMQPYYHFITDYLADQMYKLAQDNDYWPGNNYAGTSVLAAMLICKWFGFIPEFRWALKPNPIEDIQLTLANKGPVVVGTTWYQGMYVPDADGLVHPTGDAKGGHAYVLSEYDHQKKRVYSPNSWGDAGFWLSLNDLEKLIYEDGEAVVPVQRD